MILSSADNAAILASTTYMRKLLSVETNPALDLVVSRGKLVARLCELIVAESTPAIQFEAAWAVTNISSGSSTHCGAAMNHGAHSKFLHVLANSTNVELKEQCVWGLGNIAGDGVHARDMCLSEGALDAILTCFPHHNPAAPHPPKSFLRNAAWAMSNMLRGSPQPPFTDSQRDAMVCLCRLTMDACGRAQGKEWACSSGDSEILVDAAWGLSYLTNGSDSRLAALCSINAAGGACPGIIDQLVASLGSEKAVVRTPCLRTVGNIVTGSSAHVAAVVSAGFLDHVVGLMKDSKRTLRKEACWALSNITADTDTHKQQVVMVPECAATLLKCINDSEDIAKEAAYVLANLFEQCEDSGIVSMALDTGYFGVLLACSARFSSSGGPSQVCEEGIHAICSTCSVHPHIRDKVWSVVQTQPACASLLAAAGDTGMELVELLGEHFGEETVTKALGDMDYDAAVASLQSRLDGTAPLVSFGAGSGAKGKGKSNETTATSARPPAAGLKNNDAAAAALAAHMPPPSPQESDQPLANVELAPDNVSESGSDDDSDDDEVPP